MPGLPDMVFAANGGLVYGGRVLGARLTYPERAAEAPEYLARLRAAGLDLVAEPTHVSEGEGDFVVGDPVLAGTGYRTDPGAHAEAQAVLGVEVPARVQRRRARAARDALPPTRCSPRRPTPRSWA